MTTQSSPFAHSLFPVVLVFYEVTNYLANDMYLPALPAITSALNTDAHNAQMTLTFWFLGSASLQLILGPLADSWGRRPVLLGGGIIFVVSSLVCALAPNVETLWVGRFFQGSAICTIAAAGYATIHEFYDTQKAIQILAVMASVTVLAPAFGPLLGGIVLQWLSWRWIFAILAIWAAIGLGLLWLWMPEAKEKTIFNYKKVGTDYSGILRNKQFMLNTLMFGVASIGMTAWIAAGPFLVIHTFQFDVLTFGLLQAVVFGCLVISAPLVKIIMNNVGIDRLINVGILLVILGALIALLTSFILPDGLSGLIVSLMVFTMGASFIFSPSQRMAIDACQEPIGARMAIFSSMMGLFASLAGLLVSTTYNNTLFWFATLLIVLALVVTCIRKIELQLRAV